MNILLNDSQAHLIVALAQTKLKQLQTEYTNKRNEILDYIQSNAYKVSGFFWWKAKTPYTLKQAEWLLGTTNIFKIGRYETYHYRNSELRNSNTILLNKIINLNLTDVAVELTLDEYKLIFDKEYHANTISAQSTLY